MTTKMKYFAIYLPLMIMVLALSSCSSGIPQEQYDQLTSELASAQQQLEELNAKSQQQLEELNTRVEDLTKENAALEDLVNNSATLNEELSTITAYLLWYDYYYGTDAYSFDNVTAFNFQLGSLIAAIDDTNSRAAFDVYYATHYDYTTLVDALPEDNIWTLSQYESWSAAGKSRKEALGQVGVHLLNKLETIRWFAEK